MLPDGRLSLPKVGRLKVRWSRSLPSAPSSVTITLDRAGRYHASFVVEAVEAPLAPAETAVGIDLGLTSFATLSDGRKVDNPQWLRQREGRVPWSGGIEGVVVNLSDVLELVARS